jgi:hypothetical protein
MYLKKFLANDKTLTSRKKSLEIAEAPIKNCVVRLGILGVGRAFGETDVLASQRYHATLKCVSGEGSIIMIQSEEFLRLSKHGLSETS